MIFTTALCRACFQRDYPLLWVHERRIGSNWSFQRLRWRRHVYDHHRVRRSRFSHANVLFRFHRHVRERNHRRIDAQRRELRRRDIDADKRKEIASAFEEMHKNVHLPFFSREKTRKRKRKKEKKGRERENQRTRDRAPGLGQFIVSANSLSNGEKKTSKEILLVVVAPAPPRSSSRGTSSSTPSRAAVFFPPNNTRERMVTKTNKR